MIPRNRTSNLLGCPYDMKAKSMAELDRVVAAYAANLEADIKCKGPMCQTTMAIAFEMVDKNERFAISCF